MIKKDITFKGYDGKEVTRTCYFHLMKSEVMELELSKKGGLSEMIQSIVAANEVEQIVSVFKKLILASYGERDDNEHFIKSPEITQRFSNSLAYSELFMELATNADAAQAFVNGIIPQE